MKKILVSLAIFFATFSLSASVVSADNGYSNFDVSEILDIDQNDAETGGQDTQLFENIIEDAQEHNTSVAGAIILRVINLLSLLIGTFTFVTIMIGGFMMITAGGDESKIDNAKAILTQSIVGCVIAFLAYFITAFVQSFFY